MVLPLGGPLGFSIAPYLRQSRFWNRVLTPIAQWYADASGYRRIGLKYDDLLVEEKSDVQKALSRLSQREAYDRTYRLRVASQCSIIHKELPKEQWIKASEDVRYLEPLVTEAVREREEREFWDTVQVEKKSSH